VRVKRPIAAVHKFALEMVRCSAYCALQHDSEITQEVITMAEETKVQAQAAAQAPADVAKAVAETAETVANETAKAARRERATAARRAKRREAAATAPKATRRAAKTQRTAKTLRTAKPRRNTRKAARTIAAAPERIENVTNTFFNGFDAIQGAAPFQNLFADANGRTQDVVKRSQRVAEELAELSRANVEAVVEAGRVATEGARSLGQNVVASSRDGVEQAADAIRSLAEAKSPTEYMQLQGDFARASFDRMVAESSKLTESWVKLAGEAFQPLSNRASANAERFNSFVA
jgi:phasin family protein